VRVLQALGYEPRNEDGALIFANCPFHALAQGHPELVCGINLHLLRGLLYGLVPTGLTAREWLTARACGGATAGDSPPTRREALNWFTATAGKAPCDPLPGAGNVLAVMSLFACAAPQENKAW